MNTDTGQVCYVFCAESGPYDAHVETHNPSACQERVFSRKDHLRQQPRLLYKSSLLNWSTTSWMVSAPEIKSLCGFCGIALDSWDDRVEHLAEHFKMETTIDDWTGHQGLTRRL